MDHADPNASTATALRFRCLLLTGAAGALGRVLRPRLARLADTLRVSDVAEATLPAAGPGEERRVVALQDRAAVWALVEGADAIVHLGGASTEDPGWDAIRDANIEGLVNLYEGARRHGTRRIVFASSNHATGFYGQHEVIHTQMPLRPDGLYGLSKAFGEGLAQLYWDKHGIETVSLRIGSAFPAPKDRRMLATWLSYEDLERLVVAALTAPLVGHTPIYGMSANRVTWWDNRHARHVGFHPQDSSERFRAEAESRQPVLDPQDPATRLQGGGFCVRGPFFFATEPGSPT
jgi:uronate dehydrogenase